ncbi:hypothetical protein [Janthinobacterium sp. JC611]|uniref:hypothetical protein n=1 Tax=Janthinobacterium sp. JC611 TaxID=2816201 RepID=UPI001BFE4432|nr:hypothetical protein [Janthinobacterium sp. JC611]
MMSSPEVLRVKGKADSQAGHARSTSKSKNKAIMRKFLIHNEHDCGKVAAAVTAVKSFDRPGRY